MCVLARAHRVWSAGVSSSWLSGWISQSEEPWEVLSRVQRHHNCSALHRHWCTVCVWGTAVQTQWPLGGGRVYDLHLYVRRRALQNPEMPNAHVCLGKMTICTFEVILVRTSHSLKLVDRLLNVGPCESLKSHTFSF